MRLCKLLFLSCWVLLLSVKTYGQSRIVFDEDSKKKVNLSIHEGIVSGHKQTIIYKRNGKKNARIKLSEPVIVAMAEQEEEWGFYQFPSISKSDEGALLVKWTMNYDSHTAYGKSSGRTGNTRVSKNGGRIWRVPDKEYFFPNLRYGIRFQNGDILNVMTPASKDISKYESFPKASFVSNNYSFYDLDKLPKDLQGIHFSIRDFQTGKTSYYQASLSDPTALRYAIDGLMPIVWWGDICQLGDGTLVAGTYPSYYRNKSGDLLPSSVSFYKSEDKGKNWTRIGVIPYPSENIKNIKDLNEIIIKGFTEPTFTVLDDGTFLCVIRSGGTSPMYKSISRDQGKTWTKAEAFAPNGVLPTLMRLDNGVVVLTSGRPGVQIRFNLEGDGVKWTEPIDMLHFINADGGADIFCSCGYASVLPAGRNAFYIVYADFHERNANGEERKAIKFRKVTISKY